MNILWVKAGGLLPLDSGGKIRSYHIARRLAETHPVSLFLFYAHEQVDQNLNLSAPFRQVVTHPLVIPTGRGPREALEYAASALSPLPHSITKYCRPEVTAHVRRVLAADHYDLILCDFLNAAGVVPFDSGIPVALFTHNVEAMIWKRHWEVARNPLWRFVFGREAKKMQAYETEVARRADHVLTVSEADADTFARVVDRAKITAIPTGVDVEYFRDTGGAEEDTLVFTGSMDWMPNEDGVRFFVDEVLPRVWRQRPQVRLWVVGRNPGAAITALAGADARIQVTGRVDDIRPYVSRGAVYIVPLRVGGGTRLKIFEAMAMGKAVVSTTIGAEGLPVTPGKDILLADDPERFAEAVVRLLQDAQERQRLGSNARALVEERYSWQAVATEFASALEKAL
jgi:sugar transferase (PEP-CTERM/EpsH1 system associated)